MRTRCPGHILHAVGVLLAVATPLPASSETLRQALVRTYRSNPTLSADRARQRAEDENVPRAISGYFPTVGLDVSGGPNVQIYRAPGNPITTTTGTPVTGTLSINQTLYDAGKTTASVRSAESGVLAGRATLRGVEQDTLLAAATAYMDVLRDAALVEVLRSNIEALKEVLRIARKRLDTGDVSRTDPAQAESRLARGEADLAAAISNLAASRAVYRQVVGIAPDRLVFPDETVDIVGLTPAAAMAYALRNHPAIRAAAHAVDVATSDIRVNAADLLPTVTAQGSLSRTIFAAPGADQPGLPSGGTQVNVPFYDGGEASARVRQAKEVLGQSRIELDVTRDQVRAALRTALGVLDAARAAIPAGQAAVTATETALTGVRNEAQEGQRTTLDVLNAQQEVINARQNLLVARRDRIVASYAVLAAAGKLDAGSLGIRPAYRAAKHYEQVVHQRWGVRTPDGR